MELDCYKIYDTAPAIVPGRARREWMDEFEDRHPYRCLPLSMANSTGWELICPIDLEVTWNGNYYEDAIKFRSPAGDAAINAFAGSHFRSGIFTLHTGYLFRTPPGWHVACSGPPNSPKDGVSALSGVIETDWLPFPFTMNWQMTRPGTISFKAGEPFCFIWLVQPAQLEAVQPRIHKLDDHAELKAEFKAWAENRADFASRLADNEPGAVKDRWQRFYMKGEAATGLKADNHATKRSLQTPVEER